MSTKALSPLDAFGYFPRGYDASPLAYPANPLGYFPLFFGQWVGVDRIQDARKGWDKTGAPYAIASITRGVFEILGLGLLMMIIDLIVTISLKIHKACFMEK